MVGEKIYFGIDDLAGNAFIHLLQSGDKKLEVTLLSLEKYGSQIINWLKDKNIKAHGIYSRQMTNRMFDIFDEFFEESELDGKHSVKLKPDITTERLINKFRTYVELDLMNAFLNVKYEK